MRKSRFSKQYEALLRALREIRKESGMTQTEVARKFGAHASFVSKIESGERRIDVVELAEFCRIYKLALPDFLARLGLS
ncbi:MAG: helix-turn-helix transcriptional regulator [Planctomycetes bacterium]|nr:helix-turn-helix transcriptional regulator [Planctomycetota bacterium]